MININTTHKPTCRHKTVQNILCAKSKGYILTLKIITLLQIKKVRNQSPKKCHKRIKTTACSRE